jgi:lysine N6-hydroxylase
LFYALNRNHFIDNRSSIFVQNADLHSHGFNSADLGMGPYRNATILNLILGREHFKLEENIAFQRFGA